jgi:hypothetical protein
MESDEFGRDPAVQKMRRVFRQMEDAQVPLIERPGPSPLTTLRLFGRCRIYHDPVSPVLKAPAQIGWDARFRDIDLVTPRRLKGREPLMRTRGWWTREPSEIAEIVERHGKLVVGPKGELMVELADEAKVEALSGALLEAFEDQIFLSP